MRTNKSTILLAGVTLLLSMLACNIGRSPDPFEPIPPTVSHGLTESALTPEVPATEAPANLIAGVCANPYSPVIVGATWNYKIIGPISDTYTHSILSVEENGFTEQDVFGTGVTRQGKWKCEDGNLIALDPSNGSSSNVSAEGVSVDFQTTELSGVTIPKGINTGDTWTQTLTLEGTETINDMQIPAKNQLTSTCKAVGVESVTVEAGTFDAMKVECQTVMNLSLTIQDNVNQTTLTLNGTSWYVEKIGLVKTVSVGEGLDNTVELVSYSIP